MMTAAVLLSFLSYSINVTELDQQTSWQYISWSAPIQVQYNETWHSTTFSRTRSLPDDEYVNSWESIQSISYESNDTFSFTPSGVSKEAHNAQQVFGEVKQEW